ncbi:MAG: hypothetical protein AAGC67_00895 [Myxococcota bacterium]
MTLGTPPIELYDDDTTGSCNGAGPKGKVRSSLDLDLDLELALPLVDRPMPERAASVR